MTIVCPCGHRLKDTTDNLPHKAYLLPDQEWHATLMDIRRVLDAVADGSLSAVDAKTQWQVYVHPRSRLVYQCKECGRVFVADASGSLNCYHPETADTNREVLRSRKGEG